jgi:hypothetical protein
MAGKRKSRTKNKDLAVNEELSQEEAKGIVGGKLFGGRKIDTTPDKGGEMDPAPAPSTPSGSAPVPFPILK